MDNEFLLFSAKFNSSDKAARYLLPYWEDEPLESVSDEEYSEWEARNPRWLFCEDLKLKLDSSFVELNESVEGVTLQVEPEYREKIEKSIPAEHDIYFMVFKAASEQDIAPYVARAKWRQNLIFHGVYKLKV